MLEEKTGKRNGYRSAGSNQPLSRLMLIRQQLRTLLTNSKRNRNLKNRMESSRLRHQKEKYNLLQKLKTMLSAFKQRRKTGW
jgi:hypothetical protein